MTSRSEFFCRFHTVETHGAELGRGVVPTQSNVLLERSPTVPELRDPGMRVQPSVYRTVRRPIVGDCPVHNPLAAAPPYGMRDLVLEPPIEPRKPVDAAAATAAVGQILKLVVSRAE